MNDSFTSTWISSESMSTIVPIPVRVNPPPAEIGEIISPGCADFVTTTPLNGARITVFSRLASANRWLATAAARRASAASSRAAAWLARPSTVSRSWSETRSARSRRMSRSRTASRAATSLATRASTNSAFAVATAAFACAAWAP
jgi:hypothetical protein